jgi:hypothetical protein
LNSSSAIGNKWFKNDVEISGATSQTLNALESGLYKVMVVVDDCTSEFSETVNVVITDLEDDDAGVSLYPNPAKDKISVKAAWPFTEVKATSLTGIQVIISTEFQDEHETIVNLKELNKGIYILELYDRGKLLHRQKLIKE